jgi:hypothetical protein
MYLATNEAAMLLFISGAGKERSAYRQDAVKTAVIL